MATELTSKHLEEAIIIDFASQNDQRLSGKTVIVEMVPRDDLIDEGCVYYAFAKDGEINGNANTVRMMFDLNNRGDLIYRIGAHR